MPSPADKEKSLAWARTDRLQLPRVRRLPARLSENKILDETDVVKPIAPEADVPLHGGNDTGKDTQEAGHVERRSGEMPLASLGTPERRPDSTPVKVVEVEPGSVPEFKKARELAAWLKAYFAGRREETILSTGKRVRFGNGNLEASLKRGRESAHNQAYGALHDLVRQAEYDSFEGSDARHPHLGGQEVYYAALRIGDKLYSVKFKMDVPSEQELTIRKTWQGESDPEDLRYKDHALREMEIAPILYRGVVPKNGVPTQATGAISKISLAVLRDAVKPTRLEEGVLSSVQAAGRHLPPPREVFRSPGAEAIRKAVEALDQRAVHAADVRVVEDMRDLPAGLREAFAAQTGRVEGMYDPATDTVWLVAGNLENVERAIVRRYGKDPRGNEAWYIRQMEEGRLLYQDKKKSLAWARTNRLQLPQVRRLPARLSEKKIRAASDVVKPITPEADGPLVSLSEEEREKAYAAGIRTPEKGRWRRPPLPSPADKEKSLAWARTNRLQLPQVRKLPAKLSGNKVLDETDVVKPIAPEADGPLASLSEAEREKAYAA